MFDPKNRTCGFIGEHFTNPETNKETPSGCWCWLPEKVKLRVNCWLFQQTNGRQGWPKDLNSLPL